MYASMLRKKIVPLSKFSDFLSLKPTKFYVWIYSTLNSSTSNVRVAFGGMMPG